MSDADYEAIAKKNYEDSKIAYTNLKSKARMATSSGISKSVPQVRDSVYFNYSRRRILYHLTPLTHTITRAYP